MSLLPLKRIAIGRTLGDSARLVIPAVDPDTGGPFTAAGHVLMFSLSYAGGPLLVQKHSAYGGITGGLGQVVVQLVPDDYAGITSGLTYQWDVQAQDEESGAIKTVAMGVISFAEDVTKGTNLSIETHTAQPVVPVVSVAQVQGLLEVALAGVLRVVDPPLTRNSPGSPGQVAFDGQRFFWCDAENHWMQSGPFTEVPE